MVKRPRPAVTGLFLLALGLLAYERWPREAELGPVARPAKSRGEAAPLVRIGLERLDQERPGASGAGRDVFEFGRAPQPVATPPVIVTPAPGATPIAPVSTAEPGPPPVPSLAVRYIGTVEQSGTRVAVLLSDDKKEVLTGREGDTVANRLRIVRIGLESVDVQDVGSDRVRRLPLKGN